MNEVNIGSFIRIQVLQRDKLWISILRLCKAKAKCKVIRDI